MTYLPNIQVPPGCQAVYTAPNGQQHTTTNDTGQTKTLALTVMTGTGVIVKPVKPVPACTCIEGAQVWDWADPACPVHAGPGPVPICTCLKDPYELNPTCPAHVTKPGPVQAWYGEEGEPLSPPLAHVYVGKDGKVTLATDLVWPPKPKNWDQPGAEPMSDIQKAVAALKATPPVNPAKVQEQLSAVLPPGMYVDWAVGSEPEIKPLPPTPGFPVKTTPKDVIEAMVKAKQALHTAVDTSPAAENPATAPCRVYWNSHGCDKPRIHVLPGHPAGPEHQCGWNASSSSDVEPCSKVSADGGEAWGWDWDGQTGNWWPLTLPLKLYGEDAPKV